MRVQHHVAPHQRGGADVKGDGAFFRRKTKTNRIGAQRGNCRAGRHHTRLVAGGVHRYVAGLDDLFDKVGVTPAVIGVVDAHAADAVRLRLFNRFLRGVVTRHITDVIAAIHQRRHRRFLHHLDRCAVEFDFLIARHRQYARQAGEFITAQHVVDQLIDHDARFFSRIADALNSGFAQRARVIHGKAHGVRFVGVQ